MIKRTEPYPNLVSTAKYQPFSRHKKQKKRKSTSQQKSKSPSTPKKEQYLTLGEHLEVLRKHLIVILTIIFMFSIVSFVYSRSLHELFIMPYSELTNQKLLLQNVYGSIEVLIKISIMSGISFSLPLCASIVWHFITPALSRSLAWLGHVSVAASALLFWSGLLVAWFYIFPLALRFLFSDMLLYGISPQTTVEKYYSFLFLLHIGCGLVFQMPLLTILLGCLGILSTAWHKKKWKYVFIGTLLFCAFITPPDPLSQLVLSSLLLLLYGVSVFIVWLFEKTRSRS